MNEALLQELIDAGTPPLLVAKVAAEMARATALMEAATQPSKGALRTRRYRERLEASQNVTCDASDACVTQNPSLDKEKGTQKEINPTPHTHTRDASARKAETWPCPDGVDPKHWGDFLANRKRKRLVNTETARDGVLRSLTELSDDHWPPGKLVEHAAAKGWASINYPDEGPRNARSAPAIHRNGTTATGHGKSIDAGFSFIADGEPDRSDPRFSH